MPNDQYDQDAIRDALTPGVADRYRVDRQIGHGAMGVVYLAHDVRHNRPVAIKVLLPHVATAIGAERFLREIQITAQLIHPHIVPLLDSGEVDGHLFFVVPFMAGESLRSMVRRDAERPLSEVMRVVREVGEALDFAHRANIVHRDIKPDNVFLLDGHAILGDFGLARATDAIDEKVLTASGVALGSPGYMSPEQAFGARALGSRSDQYGFACLVYELMTGELPFQREDIASVLRAHIEAPPPNACHVNPDLPRRVGKVLQRAMAKAPDQRFHSVLAFVEALDEAAHRAGRAAARLTKPAKLNRSKRLGPESMGAEAKTRLRAVPPSDTPSAHWPSRSFAIGVIIITAMVLAGLAVLVGTLLFR